MEQKVQVLVDNVADSASAVLNFVSGGAGDTDRGDFDVIGSSCARDHTESTSEGAAETAWSSKETGGEAPGSGTTPAARDAGRALSKDLGQLRRLVQAAITALRNAEIEDQQRTEGVASPPQAEPAAPAPAPAVGESAGIDSWERSPEPTPSNGVRQGRERGSGQIRHDNGVATATTPSSLATATAPAATATAASAAAAAAAADIAPAAGEHDSRHGLPQLAAVHPSSSAVPPLRDTAPVVADDDSTTEKPARAGGECKQPCDPLSGTATRRQDPTKPRPGPGVLAVTGAAAVGVGEGAGAVEARTMLSSGDGYLAGGDVTVP